MAASKTVRIFTGFVDQEQLKQDLRALRGSLGKLRSIFAARGVRLRTERCDAEDPDEIRAAVADSDVCVFLFSTDVPAHTRAEFDAAYDLLKAGRDEGGPSILVWFRDADDDELTDELRAFQDELDRQMGHFFNRYAEVDTVQFQLLLHLERAGAGMPFTCVGTTLVDSRGTVIMDFAKTAAYCGNEALRAAHDRLTGLEARYQELMERDLEGELDDDQADELDRLEERIRSASQEEEELRGRFLADMRQYMRELAEDRQMSPRRRQAIRLITEGRVREGYELLDTAAIEHDSRTHEARSQAAEAERQAERGQVLDGIKQLIMRGRLLRSFVEEEGETKDAEIRHTYALAIEFEERNAFEPQAAVDYGEYLVSLGVFDKAIDLLDAACVWYRRELVHAAEAARGSRQVADPFVPDARTLREGLARALGLLAQAGIGTEAYPSAAYATSERMDVLGSLYADASDADALAYAQQLLGASRVMAAAARPDTALDYLDQAGDLLNEAGEDEAMPQLLASLAEVLEAKRDLLEQQGMGRDAEAASKDLLEVLRRCARSNEDRMADAAQVAEATEATREFVLDIGQKLTRELRARAHRLLDRADFDPKAVGEARDLVAEALGVESKAYRRYPCAETALACSEGHRQSTVLAARLRDGEAYARQSARQLRVLVAEYRRCPHVDLQRRMAACAHDLYERWDERRPEDLAERLMPELLACADALEEAAALDEDSIATGNTVGEAVTAAVAMRARLALPVEADLLYLDRLRRLRAGADTVRGLGIYSGALTRIASHLQADGRVAESFGLVSERLCALRIACGTETSDVRRYDGTPAYYARIRMLVQALGYSAQYAREHGRPAEGNALLGERLALLREIFAATGRLADVYQLNGALIEESDYRLSRGDLAGMRAVLEEAWGNACALHEAQDSLASIQNLSYVGKRVDHRYREAGDTRRAEDILKGCMDFELAYRAAHASTEVTVWVAHILWMYVVELRQHGNLELADEVFATYAQLMGILAHEGADAYLRYLHRYFNFMVDDEPDEGMRRRLIAVSVDAAHAQYRRLDEAGEAELDDLRTFSSVLELAILVTLEKHYDDLAEDYVSLCVGLYERRYDRAFGRGVPCDASLSKEECANQLSKQLMRLAASMRRFGHPDRAQELGGRSTQVLAQMHEESPGSRVSFVYSSQLFNESDRLLAEGDVAGAVALREESVAVLDRYRLADPTERNLLWYTRALKQLAWLYRDQGNDERADQVEEQVIEVLDERYAAEHARSLLPRYLYALTGWARRLHERGSNERALELYQRSVRLADDAFRTYHDVESARLLGQMQGYLRRTLLACGMQDEADDLNIQSIEAQRFLFENAPSLRGGRVYVGVLSGAEHHLRFLARRLERRDYLKRANELHSERVVALSWMARRDVDYARRLADMMAKEVTITDPRDPWVLKSMRRLADGTGHGYPVQLGVSRARTGIEALWILYRDGASPELAERLCDMKGVAVQFLMAPRGGFESKEDKAARMGEAAAELYELVPMLEERYAQVPDEAHAYRLTYYLKLASVAFEHTGRPEDAYEVLQRRAELLLAQYRKAPSFTSTLKYVHALRDQANLCDSMGRLEEALGLEDARRDLCGQALAAEGLDGHDAVVLTGQLAASLKHRERLFWMMGAETDASLLVPRTENLAAYAEALRAQLREDDETEADDDAPRLEEAADQEGAGAAGQDAGKDAGERPAAGERSDTRTIRRRMLATCLGRLAACRGALGDADAAEEAYDEAIELRRALVEAGDRNEELAGHDRLELERLLSERAALLASQLAEASGETADEEERDKVLASLDEALATPFDEDASEADADAAQARARLHLQRAGLLRAAGHDDAALLDAAAAVRLFEAVDGEVVDPFELASAQSRYAKDLLAAGRADEASEVYARKSACLRQAYGRTPSPRLGLYLSADLYARVAAARSMGHQDEALELAAERIELLCSIAPEESEQAKLWRSQFKNAIKRLLALTEDGGEASDELVRSMLEVAERSLAAKARERVAGAAAAHLDIMARLVNTGASGTTDHVAQIALHARQALAYGRKNAIEPGALRYQVEHDAQLFAQEGFDLDAQYCADELRRLFEALWSKHHDAAVGETLSQLYLERLGAEPDPAEELVLVSGQLRLARDQWLRRLPGAGAQRVLELTERVVACADAAGAAREGAEARLALVARAYEQAEQEGAVLEPLAHQISELLGAAGEGLRAMKAAREASWLDSEANSCQRNLGRAAFAWWRLDWMRAGNGSLDRVWREGSELELVQRRVHRASHLIMRSLALGDWDRQPEDHRNLRQLPNLRRQAYRNGLNVGQRIRNLSALQWALYQACNTLYRARANDPALLAESVVLRCEMLEVLADIAALQRGPKRASAEEAYVKALRTLAAQLRADEYEGIAYQDVRRWALDLAKSAHDDIAARSKA